MLGLQHLKLALVFLTLSTGMILNVTSPKVTWHYDHDNVGNIPSRGTAPLPVNATHQYVYEGLYRLTNETNPNNTGYSIDRHESYDVLSGIPAWKIG